MLNKHSEISKYDDIIDSRDVIARIEELESDLEHQTELLADHPDEPHTPARQIRIDAIADINEELASLKELAEEASGYASDWTYGETLIRSSYWVEYCQQLVEDIGDMPHGIPSYIEIDWEATARNIKMDYTTVDFDGVEYFIRSC